MLNQFDSRMTSTGQGKKNTKHKKNTLQIITLRASWFSVTPPIHIFENNWNLIRNSHGWRSMYIVLKNNLDCEYTVAVWWHWKTIKYSFSSPRHWFVRINLKTCYTLIFSVDAKWNPYSRISIWNYSFSMKTSIKTQFKTVKKHFFKTSARNSLYQIRLSVALSNSREK